MSRNKTKNAKEQVEDLQEEIAAAAQAALAQKVLVSQASILAKRAEIASRLEAARSLLQSRLSAHQPAYGSGLSGGRKVAGRNAGQAQQRLQALRGYRQPLYGAQVPLASAVRVGFGAQTPHPSQKEDIMDISNKLPLSENLEEIIPSLLEENPEMSEDDLVNALQVGRGKIISTLESLVEEGVLEEGGEGFKLVEGMAGGDGKKEGQEGKEGGEEAQDDSPGGGGALGLSGDALGKIEGILQQVLQAVQGLKQGQSPGEAIDSVLGEAKGLLGGDSGEEQQGQEQQEGQQAQGQEQQGQEQQEGQQAQDKGQEQQEGEEGQEGQQGQEQQEGGQQAQGKGQGQQGQEGDQQQAQGQGQEQPGQGDPTEKLEHLVQTVSETLEELKGGEQEGGGKKKKRGS